MDTCQLCVLGSTLLPSVMQSNVCILLQNSRSPAYKISDSRLPRGYGPFLPQHSKGCCLFVNFYILCKSPLICSICYYFLFSSHTENQYFFSTTFSIPITKMHWNIKINTVFSELVQQFSFFLCYFSISSKFKVYVCVFVYTYIYKYI